MKFKSKLHGPIFQTFREIRQERHRWAGSDQFNDSASYKMVIKINFNFFRFLKVLELFECRRGDLYKTANNNFVRFADS